MGRIFGWIFKGKTANTDGELVVVNLSPFTAQFNLEFCYSLHARKKIFISLFVAIIVILGVTAAFHFGGQQKVSPHAPKLLGGAVAANGQECAKIGADMFLLGGSVADAAIATMLCEGVTCPQSTGLGGGFLLTIYTKATGVVETLNAREVAPKAATYDMFVNDSKAALVGGLSIAVPGEIKGMWELHQKYGKLPWSELFKSTIELCRHGITVTPYLARILYSIKDEIYQIESIREVFINPETNSTWLAGDKLKRTELARTMEVIAEEGADSIYQMGTIGKKLLEDIRSFGGILTEKDFTDYK